MVFYPGLAQDGEMRPGIGGERVAGFLGGLLAKAGVFQGAAHQDPAVPARDQIAVLVQDDAFEGLRGCAKQDHLPQYRLDGRAGHIGLQQFAGPGAGADDDSGGRESPAGRLHALDTAVADQELRHGDLLVDPYRGFDGAPAGLDQARIAHLRHLRQPDCVVELGFQGRFAVADGLGAEGLQLLRGMFPPHQRGLRVAGVEYQQAVDVVLGVDTALVQEALCQAGVGLLAPAGKTGNAVRVTPGVEGGDNTASRPGGFTSGPALLEECDGVPLRGQLPGGEHADEAAADNDKIRHMMIYVPLRM